MDHHFIFGDIDFDLTGHNSGISTDIGSKESFVEHVYILNDNNSSNIKIHDYRKQQFTYYEYINNFNYYVDIFEEAFINFSFNIDGDKSRDKILIYIVDDLFELKNDYIFMDNDEISSFHDNKFMERYMKNNKYVNHENHYSIDNDGKYMNNEIDNFMDYYENYYQKSYFRTINYISQLVLFHGMIDQYLNNVNPEELSYFIYFVSKTEMMKHNDFLLPYDISVI